MSSSTETEINLPYITAVDGVPKHLVLKLTRAKFEQLADKLFARCLKPCEDALKDAGYGISEINEVNISWRVRLFHLVSIRNISAQKFQRSKK